MAEYIERDKLKRLILDDNAPFTVSMVIRHIDKCPAADVAPVRHGRWIGPICSICENALGPRNAHQAQYYKFCPHCGAKME